MQAAFYAELLRDPSRSQYDPAQTRCISQTVSFPIQHEMGFLLGGFACVVGPKASA